MSDPNQPSTPAGWYPDGQGGQRWWDGTQWTEHTQPSQGAAPAAPAEPTPPADSAPIDPMQTVVAPRTPAQGLPPQAGAGQPPTGPPPAQPGMQSGYQQPGVPPWQSQTPATGGGGKGKLIAIVVGALVLVVVAAVVLFTVVLGGGPKGVAEDYLKATLDLDIEKVCELSSESSQDEEFADYEVETCSEYQAKFEEQENYDQIVALFEDVETEIEIGDVKEKGDSATVKYTEKIKYTGDDEEGFTEFFGEDTEITEKGTLTMVKEDGDWKVDDDVTD